MGFLLLGVATLVGRSYLGRSRHGVLDTRRRVRRVNRVSSLGAKTRKGGPQKPAPRLV